MVSSAFRKRIEKSGLFSPLKLTVALYLLNLRAVENVESAAPKLIRLYGPSVVPVSGLPRSYQRAIADIG
jgi:hypothetical protein